MTPLGPSLLRPPSPPIEPLKPPVLTPPGPTRPPGITGGIGSILPPWTAPPTSPVKPPVLGPFGRMGDEGGEVWYRWVRRSLMFGFGCDPLLGDSGWTPGFRRDIKKGDTLRAGIIQTLTGSSPYCPQDKTFVIGSLSIVRATGEELPVGANNGPGGNYPTEFGSVEIHINPVGRPVDDPLPPITIDPEITFPDGWDPEPKPQKDPDKQPKPLPPIKPKVIPPGPPLRPPAPEQKPDIDPKPPKEPTPRKPPTITDPKPGDPQPEPKPAKPPTPGKPPAPKPKPGPGTKPGKGGGGEKNPAEVTTFDPLTGKVSEVKPLPAKPTPKDQHLTKDGPATGNGPQPNLEEIARELGRQEQKLEKIINRVTPQQGGPLDIGDLLQILNIIRDLLTNNVSGTIYEVEAACTIRGEDEPRRHAIEVPGGLDKNMAAIARLDAIAELIGAAQLLKQATCGRNTSTPGNNVTVTAYEVIEE